MRVSALEAKSNNTTSSLVDNKEVQLEDDDGWIATHINGTLFIHILSLCMCL